MAECRKPTKFGRCRKCNPCLEHRQRTWLLRMMLEAMLYPEDQVTFLTLTYAPKNLPSNEEESKRSVQLWLKRLRKQLDIQIRYVAALETGSQNTHRYHWHVILYGLRFTHTNKHIITKSWGNGFIDWQPSTPGKMHYVLKYVIKKSKFLMSRRPGIGTGMIPALQALLTQLSTEERIKLRSNYSTLHYPDKDSPLTRIRIGKYDYPLHPFLKKALRQPKTGLTFEDTLPLLKEIYDGKEI